MSNDTLGLRAKREAAGFTQREFANRLDALDPEGGWDQSKVSRYEKNQASIPAGSLMKMLHVLGATSFTFDRPTSKGVDLGAPYEHVFDEIVRRSRMPSGTSTGWSESLLAMAQRVTKKPLIGLVGPFDAGKTTVLNTLLGSDSLPTSYQPETYMVTFIHHVDDRPEGRDQAVYIMKEGFDPTSWGAGAPLNDDDVVEEGSLDCLRRREGDGIESENGVALVFLDAPVLQACSLVDTPGSLEGSAQTWSVPPFDAAIVCSPSTGFMHTDGLARVLEVLGLLSHHTGDPLDRLLILVTHAHARVPDAVLSDTIIPGGAKRIARLMEARADDPNSVPSQTDIEARILAFDPDHAERSDRFLAFVGEWWGLGSQIQKAHLSRAVEVMQLEHQLLVDSVTAQLSAVRESLQEQSDEPRESPQQFNRRVDLATKRVQRLFERHRKDSLQSAFDIAANYTPERVEEIIKRRFDDRKDAREGASLVVLNAITHAVERDLKSRTQEMQEHLGEWIDSLEGVFPKFYTSGKDGTFNFRSRMFGAFAGAGVGTAGVGAAGAYAATLGNLGAYILVAKGVSALSALGISVGGVGTAVSAVAAIGGPITLGIAGIAVLSLAGFSVIGGNWRKTLAKQIHKKLVTEILFRDPAQSKAIGEGTRSIPESLESYWTDLRQSLDRAMREAKKAYQELYDSQPDIAALKDLVESLDTAQTWLSRITFDDLTIASS